MTKSKSLVPFRVRTKRKVDFKSVASCTFQTLFYKRAEECIAETKACVADTQKSFQKMEGVVIVDLAKGQSEVICHLPRPNSQ